MISVSNTWYHALIEESGLICLRKGQPPYKGSSIPIALYSPDNGCDSITHPYEEIHTRWSQCVY